MNEAIQRLMAQLGDFRAKAEVIKGFLNDRDLTDAEDKEFAEVLGEIRKINGRIEQLRQAELLLVDKSVILPTPAGVQTPVSDIVEDAKLDKGVAMARALRCLLQAKGSLALAGEIAEQFCSDTPSMAKMFKGQAMGLLPKFGEEKAAVAAATTTGATWAAPLIWQTNLVSEFVGLLYPKTILGNMTGFTEVPFNVSIPRMTGGVTGGWVGEGGWKPVSAGAFDRIELKWNKLAVIVVFTDEMLRWSSPAIDALMRDNIVEAFGEMVDQTFILYTGTASTAKPGPINGNGAGAALQAVPSTGITVDFVTADLNSAIGNLTASGIPMRNPYWVMSQRTYQSLLTLPGVNDEYAFRAEMLQGRLLGYPFIASTSVPINMGVGTDESFITLLDASQFFLAREGVSFDMSNQATLEMDSAPSGPATVSMWQTNMTALKGEQYITWRRKRDTMASTITGVAY